MDSAPTTAPGAAAPAAAADGAAPPSDPPVQTASTPLTTAAAASPMQTTPTTDVNTAHSIAATPAATPGNATTSPAVSETAISTTDLSTATSNSVKSPGELIPRGVEGLVPTDAGQAALATPVQTEATPATSVESTQGGEASEPITSVYVDDKVNSSVTSKKAKKKKKNNPNKKKRSFLPGSTLTVGITKEMREEKSAEEFENDLDMSTVNRMMGNVRSVIPSMSDISSAFTTASKSVSDLSVAAVAAAHKVSDASKTAAETVNKASKSASETAISTGGWLSQKASQIYETAAAAKQKTSNAITAAAETANAVSERVSAASKSISDTTTAIMETAAVAKQRTSDAITAASETAHAVGEKVSAASKSISETTTAIMETAAAAKQRTSDAMTAASETAHAVSEKVTAASKSISDTTTAIMETASAAKQKISDASKAASETAAVVSESVQKNVAIAHSASRAAIETAAPVVSAVGTGAAMAVHTVSDVASMLSSPTVTTSETMSGLLSPGQAELAEEFKKNTSSAFSMLSSGLSRGLSSIFTSTAEPATTPTRVEYFTKDDREMISLGDLCTMPESSYAPPKISPPSSVWDEDDKCPVRDEQITIYDCEIEQTYAQSTGTNSYESVVLMKEAELNKGVFVKHPNFGGAQKQATVVNLIGTERPTKKVEEWELRQLEKSTEAVPINSVPHIKLGDREHWLLNQIMVKIQNKYTATRRHDFTITFKRGIAANGLPYMEIDVTPIVT